MRSSKPRRCLGSWRRWSRGVRSHPDSVRDMYSSLPASTGGSGPLPKPSSCSLGFRQSSSGSDSSSQGRTSSCAEEKREGGENKQQGTLSWMVEWICWGDAPTSMPENVLWLLLSHVTNSTGVRSCFLHSLHILPVVVFFVPGGTFRKDAPFANTLMNLFFKKKILFLWVFRQNFIGKCYPLAPSPPCNKEMKLVLRFTLAVATLMLRYSAPPPYVLSFPHFSQKVIFLEWGSLLKWKWVFTFLTFSCFIIMSNCLIL